MPNNFFKNVINSVKELTTPFDGEKQQQPEPVPAAPTAPSYAPTGDTSGAFTPAANVGTTMRIDTPVSAGSYTPPPMGFPMPSAPPRTDNTVRQAQETPLRDNIVNLNASVSPNIAIVNPVTMADAKIAVEHLRAMRTLCLVLEKTDRKVSQRVLDFVSGAAFAMHGNVQRATPNSYIITPNGVSIVVDDIVRQTENDSASPEFRSNPGYNSGY